MVVVDNDNREVYFDQYCKSCKHRAKKENEEPCCDCLEEPMNLYTSKPVKLEEE